jgi:hypothetical protein
VAICQFVLGRESGGSAPVLVAVVAAALLLRARSFPTVRLRVPLLAAGLAGLAALALGPAFDSTTVRLTVVAPALLLIAVFTAAAGLTYSRKAPSPYLGRIGDTLDLLLVIAVVPVACGVLGLYGYARGIAG